LLRFAGGVIWEVENETLKQIGLEPGAPAVPEELTAKILGKTPDQAYRISPKVFYLYS